MKYFSSFFISLFLLLFSGCSQEGPNSPQNQLDKNYGFSFIEGTVSGFFADKVIIQIQTNFENEESEYEKRLANSIIKNSLFIPGLQTYIEDKEVNVSDVRGNEVTFNTTNTKFTNRQKVKIYIPKKTIAIMDFSLISENNRPENFTLEDMVTKIVQSGQYIVVERKRLDTILKEQKLSDSGLLNNQSASKIGKLLSADILLTGTFEEKGDSWSINLRLVDVATGIILVAINEKVSLDEYKPKNPISPIELRNRENRLTPPPRRYTNDGYRRSPPPPRHRGNKRRPPPRQYNY